MVKGGAQASIALAAIVPDIGVVPERRLPVTGIVDQGGVLGVEHGPADVVLDPNASSPEERIGSLCVAGFPTCLNPRCAVTPQTAGVDVVQNVTRANGGPTALCYQCLWLVSSKSTEVVEPLP